MDSCRVCLASPKMLYSLFERADIIYAEMIYSIARVKVAEGDGFPDKICRSCKTKVKEAYDLKTLIERSNAALQFNRNRLLFNNIDETNIKKDYPNYLKNVNKSDKKVVLKFEKRDNVVYNDTTIKKVNIDKKPLSIVEFLEHIKEEEDFDLEETYFADDIHSHSHYNSDEDNYPIIERFKKMSHKKSGQDSDEEFSPGPIKDKDDEEYTPKKGTKKKNGVKKNPYKKKSSDSADDPASNPALQKTKRILTKVLIKPVILSDIEVAPSKMRRKTGIHYKRRPEFELCPHCGKQTKSLKSHLLVHIGTKSFKCDQCSKSYLTKKQLDRHTVKHSGPPSYNCDQCIGRFYSERDLTSHKTVHMDERKFICPICNKAFKRKANMNRHQLSHNSANRNIKCELCKMTFYTPYSLRHHMRIHTGERPFKCELCSQPYSYKHDFNRHCLKKHGIFLKRRKVYVMNEQVLLKEREIMKDVVRRAQGILKEGESMNPFESEGTASYQALTQAVKALQNNQIQIPVDI